MAVSLEELSLVDVIRPEAEPTGRISTHKKTACMHRLLSYFILENGPFRNNILLFAEQSFNAKTLSL